MAKILTVIGTRPQYIKLIPNFGDVLVDTGQHYDDNMSGDFIKEFSIKPDYCLGETTVSGMMRELRKILREIAPSLIVVYGDTNSAFAGAMAAKEAGIKIAHIEAGVRCYDNKLPEEFVRVEIDKVSDYLFCPIPQAVENLKKEGITKNVYYVGDVLYDKWLKWNSGVIIDEPKYHLPFLTVHRQENMKIERLQEIFYSFINNQKKVLFPIHPGTKEFIVRNLYSLLTLPEYVKITEPLSHEETLKHIFFSEHVFTDSGGIQREAIFSNTPCTVLRKKNEWEGTKRLDYGDGTAGQKIKNILKGVV